MIAEAPSREVSVLVRPILSAMAAAVVLVGCSSTGEGATATLGAPPEPSAVSAPSAVPTPAPDVDAPTLGELLAEASRHQTSGRFEAAVRVQGVPELPDDVQVSFWGASAGPSQAGQVTFDLDGLATAIEVLAGDGEAPPPQVLALLRQPVQLIVVDDALLGRTTWVRSDGLASVLGHDPGWIELAPQSLAALGPAVAGVAPPTGSPAQPTDPAALLELLSAVDQPVEATGSDTLRGVATTRYRATIDLGEVLTAVLGFAATPGLAADPDEAMPLVVELWIDQDGALRQAELRADVDEPGRPPVTITFSLELFDLGEAIDINPPPADQVTPVEELDLEALAALFG